MRKFKKVLAVVLAVMTLCSAMPFTAFAAENGLGQPIVTIDEVPGQDNADMADENSQAPPTSGEDEDVSEPVVTDTPAPTVEPTASPEASPSAEPATSEEVSPSAEPTATAEPSETDEPTATDEPTVTDESSASPSPAPEATPAPETVSTPEPSAEPTAPPSAEPTEQPEENPGPYLGEYSVLEAGDPDAAYAWPVPEAYTITQGFGGDHHGWDIAADLGTSVTAAAAGTVVQTYTWDGNVTKGDTNAYGNMVLLRHADGSMTRYAHLSEYYVQEGDEVVQGQEIGAVGSTGDSTGPHLHFEIIENATRVDPAEFGYFEAGIIPVEAEFDTNSEAEYILAHADPAYVGTGDKAQPFDFMRVAFTLADRSMFDHNPTLDDMWTVDEDGDGISDNWMAALGQFEAYKFLYEVSPDSDYYVAWADAGFSNAVVTDWLAGNSNAGLAELYDDVVYDAEAGLVYVPKSYTTAATEGAAGLGHVRLQVLYAVNDAEDLSTLDTEVSVTVNTSIADNTVTDSTTAQVSAISSYVEVDLGAYKNVSGVSVNGLELDKSEYEFDSGSGQLTINKTAATINTIDVDVEDVSPNANNGIATIAASGRITDADIKAALGDSWANQLHSLGLFEFDGVPVNGSAYIIPATNTGYDHNDNSEGRPGYVKPCLDAYVSGQSLGTVEEPEDMARFLWTNTWRSQASYGGFPWGGFNDNGYSAAGASEGLQRYATLVARSNLNITPTTVASSTRSEVKLLAIPSVSLDLFCAHLGISSSYNDYNGGFNQTSQDGASDPLFMRILYSEYDAAKGTGMAIVAVGLATVETQAGIGYFAINFKAEIEKKVTFQKTSANPSMTNGNSNYGLAGAVYRLYNSRADAENNRNIVTEFRTDSTGKATGTIPGWKTYWAKEITAPKGYVLDPVPFQVTFSQASPSVTHADQPVKFTLRIQKVDKKTGQPKAPGNATLAGAVFQLTKPDGTTVNLPATNAAGVTSIGDLILGKYTIKEITAPAGFTLKESPDDIYVTQEEIAASGTATYTKNITIDEERQEYYIRIGKKYEAVTASGVVQKPEVGARFEVYLTSKGSYAACANEERDILTIGSDGTATSKALVYGNYTVRQLDDDNKALDKTAPFTVNAVSTENLHTYSYDFVNHIPYGIIKIHKTATDGAVSGLKFKITRVQDGWTKTYNTDSTGWITTENLPVFTDPQGKIYANYRIEEVDTPPRYVTPDPVVVNLSRGTVSEPIPVKTVDVDNIVKQFQVDVVKEDLDSKGLPQGDATLAGAVYGVYLNGALLDRYTTDADGRFTTKTYDCGTGYTIQEITPSKGYLLDSTVYTLDTAASSQTQALRTLSVTSHETVIRGGVEVKKNDASTGDSSQGDGSLQGIKFVVSNASDHAVRVTGTQWTGGAQTEGTVKATGEQVYAPGEDILVLVTDELGVAKTAANNVLPYGTYEIREVRSDWTIGNEGSSIYANEAYLWSAVNVHTFKIVENGRPVFLSESDNNGGTFKAVNEILRGSVQIQKYDLGNNNATPQGDASLADIVFTVKNTSNKTVYIPQGTPGLLTAGRTTVINRGITSYVFTPGDDILTITTNAAGVATSPSVLPYGTYTVRETKTNDSMLLTDSSEHEFEIRENATVVTKGTNGDDLTYGLIAKDEVVRGGVKVEKDDANIADDTQGDGSLKGIKFVVSNESEHAVRVTGTQWTGGAQTEGTVKATGEQVYAPGEDILVLVTDELGVAKTAANNVLPYGTYEIREVRSDWTIGNEGSSIYANEAYLWSAVNVHTFKIVENGRPVFLVNSDNNGGAFTAVNEVLRGSVQIQKYDLGNDNATPQGDASLADIVFTVKNTSNKTVYIPQGTPGLLTAGRTTVIHRGVTSYVFTPGDDILTITTNAAGVATSPSVLPYGTYTVRETKTNDSMLLTDSSEHEFEIRENAMVVTKGTNGDDLTYGLIAKDEVVRGGVKVEKDDANIADDTQGDGSLKGIKFVVSNESKHAVRVTGIQWTGGAQTEGTVKATGEQVYAPGEDILVLVTDEQGIAQTALSNVLPYGTYKIREVRMDWTAASEGTSAYANTSYMYSADNEHTFKVLKNGTTVFLSESDNNGGTFKAVNEILRGGLEIEKRDAETRKQKAQGGATLKDTEFEIVNKSTKAVFIDVDGNGTMEKYDVDSKILSIFTDEEGKASLPADFLPKGTYEICEVKASTGYLLSDDLPRQFTISFNGQIQEYKGEPTSGKTGLEQDGAWFNHPIRGDVLFVKERDADNRHLEDIPFLLISTTTGEQHILVSDENGQVNTAASWNPHTQDTNKNDSLYDETGMTWSEHPDHEAGVWFGEGAPDDTVGALLYDTYIIRELPYETSWDGTPFKEQDPNGGNKGMRLWTDTVTMHRNGLEWDMGTVRNRAKPRVSMWTTATDKFDDDKLAYGYYNTTISDKVEVVADQGLAGIELRIEGVLMDKATGEPVLVNGEKVTATKEFIPHSNTFTETLDYTFDARQLDGHDVVVFENLYEVDSGEQLATHEDIEDVDQTVHIIVPGLDSSAYNGEEQPDISSRTKIVVADTHSTITDEVYLTGLIPGQNYTLRSVIINDSYEDNIPTPAVFDGRTMEEHWQDGTADRVEALMMEIFADWGIPYNNNFVNPTTGMWFDLPAVVDEPAIDRALDRYEDVLDVMAWDHSNFVATSDKMTVTTSFEDLNTVAKRGQNLRCFQILTSGNTLLATEVVSQYEAETVNVIAPTIGTTATVEGLHIADPMDTVTLEDVVSYENVIPGNEYVLKGILMDKATGEPLLIDGKEITGETTFTPTEATGSTKVLFTFKAVGLAGKSVVAFETLYREGYELTVHADIEDEGQTVTFEKPEIHTTATSEDGTKETDPLGKVTLKDSVHYTGLIPGHQYKVTGKLMDKDTGEAVVVDGQEITSAAIFTASASEGSVDVTFVFDASNLHGHDVVAFETLTREDTELAVHTDIEDENQTVHVHNPEIGTTATVEGGKAVDAFKSVTLTDTVAYKDLTPGKEYTLTGKLMDKSTGKPLLVNGKEVTSEATFTATAENGSTDVTFTFDARGLQGHELVVFEELYREGTQLAVHADIEDKDQTIRVRKPELGTTATVEDAKETDAYTKVVLEDVVKYTDLTPGKTYTVTGVLMDKASGKALLVDGKEVTSEATFTAASENGSVTVTFTFDGRGLQGHEIVAFETLYREDVELAVHADIEDENQTVRVRKPEIGTTATVEGAKEVDAFKSVTLVDVVKYTDLTPGKTYTMSGVLMDKATGKALLVKGKEVTAETIFTPVSEAGSVEVTFVFDATGLQGHELVVFENLFRDDAELAVHTNIEDKDQTIRVRNPEIGTTATADEGEKEVDPLKEITLIDVVKYTDLTPGKTYTMTGVLMDKATGKALLVAGKEVTASTKFTAENTDGSVEVTFVFDASALHGHDVVAFESVYREDVELAVHADIDDDSQTVHVREPEIGTTATADEGEKEVDPLKEITLIDVVEYTDLTPGRTYTMTGVLMDKATGEALLVDGKEVTASTQFTAENTNGTVDVVFTFDASALRGHDIVAFESLVRNNTELAVHTDIEDKDQTVHVREPEIGTTATVDDGAKDVDPLKEITLIDTVEYSDLTPGKEYTVIGVLMDKATGEALLVDGKEVTASATFTPEEANGTVDVTFVFDASNLHGHDVVAFETLTREDTELAVHTDIEDENQTVHVHNPEIGTTATVDDGAKDVDPLKEITLIDTVEYSDLTPGKTYTVTGVLMDKATGEAIRNGDKEVTASATFTPEAADGTVDVTFVFDGSNLHGHDVVAFETLSREDTELAVHTDIEDENQTVHVHNPEIGTTATVEGEKDVDPLKEITLIDTVEYSDLTPGKEYTVTGVLMDKATGEAIRNGDKEVTASTTFTPEAADGTVDVTFVFDGSNLHGHDVVAFETLSREDTELAVHTDIEDENQTVHVREPEIGTTATVDDGAKDVDPLKEITLIDTVEYSELTPGKEYTLTGVLMDKATGEAIRNGDKEVTASATFTTEAADGSVDVTFVFDASNLHGHDVVAFETLSREDTELAVHTDIEDENQTVHVHNPEIGTTATVEGEKEVDPLKEITLIDTVEYSDLTPGKEYTLTGVLMDKATGEALLVDGKEVTASATFTPEEANGTVDVTFVFDASNLHGHDVVAFETLTREDTELAVHADIEDETQTVHVHNPEIGTTATVEGEKLVRPKGTITLTDVVAYSDLTPGKEYTVTGVLMDKSTGEALLIDGKEVTASTTFVAEEANGTVNVVFEFEGKGLAKKEVVVFESLYHEDTELAVHADIDDDNQTVTFKPNDGRLSISRGNLPGTPNTGDREPFLPWLCAFVASAVVLLGMIFAARKRKLAKQLMSLALVVIAVAAMMLPMYANADEVAQPITETLQVEAATEDEAKAAGSFEEQIAVDGTIYALAGVEAELESSRAVVEEKTVEKTEEMTVGEKNAEFDQTMTKDGVEYRLSDVSYDSVQEDGYHVPSITETVDLGIAETEPEAEPSITKTYHIDEYDKDVEMTLPLVDVVRGDPIWVDDVALPMTIIGMDADQLAFDGGYVAFDGTTPPLEGNEELFLRYLGLDVNGYNLTSAEWTGEEYENEDGEYCRDDMVYGNRVTYPYTAVYGGEDLLVPAFEVYKATATYSAEVEEETGEQINTYQLTATYNPLEEVEEDHIPTGLIVAGAAVGVVLLAALIAVILFILSRKRRKEDENR